MEEIEWEVVVANDEEREIHSNKLTINNGVVYINQPFKWIDKKKVYDYSDSFYTLIIPLDKIKIIFMYSKVTND